MDKVFGPIVAMHARYEAAWEEYNRIDEAGLGLKRDFPTDLRTEFRLETAKKLNTAETDALRLALLYQVPNDAREAMILAYHIHIAHDLTDRPSQEERQALETAIDTLFDYLCCETSLDHEAIGKAFQRGANLAFEKRRLRNGITEDL